MKRTMGVAFAASALACTFAATASAQSRSATTGERFDYLSQPVRAPVNAFEIGVDVGYMQGFGSLRAGNTIMNVAGPGGTIGLSLGYRASPLLYVGWTGRLQEYSAGSGVPEGTSIHGVGTALNFNFHTAPYERMDPWLGVGAGYRGILRAPVGAVASGFTQGFDILKLQAGLDLRVSEDTAVSPVLGFDLDTFVWDRPMGGDTTTTMRSPRISTFIYAGVQGRFDVTGDRRTGPPRLPTRVGQQ